MIKTITLDSPTIAKMPNTERTHKRSSTDAIAWRGRGKIPIAQHMTARISISHRVTGWLLRVKRIKLGIEMPATGNSPKTQSKIRIKMIGININ